MAAMVTKFKLFSCLGLVSALTGCASGEETRSSSTRTETCINGVCSTTTSNSNTVSKGRSSGASVGVDGVSVSVGDGGSGSVEVSTGNVRIVKSPSVETGGTINLTPCYEVMAPISACLVVGKNVMMPKHLGCTASGAHAWSCQDSFSGPPPHSVIVCNGMFSDSCNGAGVIY